MGLLIATILLIIFWQIPGLIKSKQYKELVAFSVLTFIAGLYSALLIFNVRGINPIRYIIDYVPVLIKTIGIK